MKPFRFVRSLHHALVTCCLCLFLAPPAVADNQQLAPDFSALAKSGKLLITPPDVELYSISAGGVVEPKADWTELALKHARVSLKARSGTLGLNTSELSEADADELAELGTLHAAVARSIALHHFGPRNLALPTKDGKLDWSLGEAVRPLRDKSGADYALFLWMRDSYASDERKAAMVVMAILGVGLAGGVQTGYASLVDLRTGRVLWFNRLLRASGDLRNEQGAEETVTALLQNFPGTK